MINLSDTAKRLKTIGLGRDEAIIYGYLLEHGPQKAIDLRKGSGLPKPLVYRALRNLEEQKLVEQLKKPGKISIFSPADPRGVRTTIDSSIRELEQNKSLFESMIPELLGQFMSHIHHPVIQYSEGTDGLRALYNDILQTKSDILLFQSPFDADLPDINTVVQDQIKQQVALGIHVRALTPHIPTTAEWFHNHDSKNLVERRIIPENMLQIPAQIIVYGDKVGISSMHQPHITTIIQNSNIHNTFVQLFETIWQLATPIHDTIVANLQQR